LNVFKIPLRLLANGRTFSGMVKSARGEQTRIAIVEAALRLFAENGYEATTMRAIATQAGVATGNAYYYYASKEDLVREYFERHQAEHAAACRQVLAQETRLGPRIAGVLRALVEVLAPCRGFAARPYWQAGPAAIGLYAEVIGGARGRIPARGHGRLAELLWLYSMGIVLFWAHDTSPGSERTYRLIDSTAPIAARLIRLAWLPGLRSVLRQLMSAVNDTRRP
jgi:AcrR family transcriptional regulator